MMDDEVVEGESAMMEKDGGERKSARWTLLDSEEAMAAARAEQSER
jgi:hypothetical protein